MRDRNTDRLTLCRLAYQLDYLSVIENAITNGRKEDARLLAKIALNTGFNADQYPVDINYLTCLDSRDFPFVIQYLFHQRPVTSFVWDADLVERLINIAKN